MLSECVHEPLRAPPFGSGDIELTALFKVAVWRTHNVHGHIKVTFLKVNAAELTDILSLFRLHNASISGEPRDRVQPTPTFGALEGVFKRVLVKRHR